MLKLEGWLTLIGRIRDVTGLGRDVFLVVAHERVFLLTSQRAVNYLLVVPVSLNGGIDRASHCSSD